MELWDTAGQERYDSLTQMYYRNATVVLLLFSLADEQTFVKVDEWYNVLQGENNEAIKIVVGNKSDIGQSSAPARQFCE